MKVNTDAMVNCVIQMGALSRDLDAVYSEICGIRLRLGFNITTKPRIAASLVAASQAVERERDVSRAMHDALTETIALYRQVEQRNAGKTGGAGSNSGNGGYQVDSIVFDDVGGYGGDQGHLKQVYYWDPIKCWDVLHDLRLYYPDMSIFDAFRYVSALNSVGCGYVAIANTLFMEYEGRPEDFERTFGYPMYKDGDLNYDRLILDIYATTDKSGINIGPNGLPKGTTDASRAQIMENFLSDKPGISVRTDPNVNVTAENFKAISESGGKVVIGYRKGVMYDAQGNEHKISAHAMTVTGVTDDGRYIVSSWGEKYYINASDIDSNDSFMTFYYES